MQVLRGICECHLASSITEAWLKPVRAVLLEPGNTEIVGGMVEHLEATQAETFIASLAERIDTAKNRGNGLPAPNRRRTLAQTGANQADTNRRGTTARGIAPQRSRPALATFTASGPSVASGPSSSSRPQRAARQDASAKIERMYEQTAQLMPLTSRAGPSRITAQRTITVDSDAEDMDSFEADASFLRHVDEVEMRARAQRQPPIEMIDDDEDEDYGDDIEFDDSFIRGVDEAELRASTRYGQVNRAKRKEVIESDSESDVVDSGKENKPIVIDSD